MQFAINDQDSGLLVCGQFIVTIYRCSCSSLCSCVWLDTVFHHYINPLYPPDMFPCDFFPFIVY